MSAQDRQSVHNESATETQKVVEKKPQASQSKSHQSSQDKSKAAQWAARSLLSLVALAILVLGLYLLAVKNAWLQPPAWWATFNAPQESTENLDTALLAQQQSAQEALQAAQDVQTAKLQDLVSLLQAQANRVDQLADQLAVSKTAELRLRQQLSLMQDDIEQLKAGKKAEIPADVALALSRLITLSQSRMQVALTGASETEADYLGQIEANKNALKEDYSLARISEALLSLIRVRDNAMVASDYSVLVDWQFWFLLRLQAEGLQASLVNPDINPAFVAQQLKTMQAQMDTHPLAQTREELTAILTLISKGFNQ